MRTHLAECLVLGLVLAACASHPEPIGTAGIVGERARIFRSPDSTTPYVGILRSYDGDTATLESSDGPLLPFTLSPSARLEISRGTRSHAGQGAAIGAVIGGAGLALLGAVNCSNDDGFFDVGPGECAAAGALLGGAAGALVGLVIGSTQHSESWVEVDRTR